MIPRILAIFFVVQLLLVAQPLEKADPGLLHALKNNSGESIQALVLFPDKNISLQEALRHPLQYVSERSLQRRKKVLPAYALLDYSDIPVSESYISLLEQTGVKIRHTLKWFNAVSVTGTAEQIQKILTLPQVMRVEQLAKYAISKNYAENTNIYTPSEPAKHNTSIDYGSTYNQVSMINIPQLHDMGYYGQNVIVAVLDAGFNNLPHEVFSTMEIIAKYDFVNNDAGVGDSTDQGIGNHGTETLSAIGGYKPGTFVGPAFKSKYILCKTENTYSETPVEEDNWIAAMQWVDSIGADLSSTSLGYVGFDPPFTSYTWQDMNGNTCRITKAADLAVKKGIAVFNSAGNEGFDFTHNTLVAPADGDSVIAVGAVSVSGERASFSSVGNTVDGRIKPDIMAMGQAVILASPFGPTDYTIGSGTSFSCPLAAGAGAVLLSARPHLTPMQLRDALRSTASMASQPNREYGWGIINAFAALNTFPLSVSLISFNGTYEYDGISLQWKTASETNNLRFTITSSFDKKNWLTRGVIAGSGNNTGVKEYSFKDKVTKLSSTIFYRLEMLDYSGKVTYSDILTIRPEGISFALSQNFPNPFNPATKISYRIGTPGKVTLNISNTLGETIAILVNESLETGIYSVDFNGKGYPAGVYYYTLSNGSERITKKMTLIK